LVTRPRLVATRNGASIKQLLAGELLGGSKCRIISGSALNGRNAAGNNHFLGRYHNQVTVIEEGGKRKFFGWSGLSNKGYTASGMYRKSTGHTRQHDFSTARNGRFSGMLPMRVFERLMPLDILPSPLFRALLVMDTDQAQALGCLELAEEDLALCSFACPAKTDYGGALRATLEHIEKQG
jgi:Na+-transporting NADH:ubiquinone oxidoreductase subunit A